MRKLVDVIFWVEHQDRELESIKRIAASLERKGKSSLILSVHFHIHYLYHYQAKVFVFPYLINKNDWPVKLIYEMFGESVAYVNMNWEQLISKVNQEYKKPQDDFVKQQVRHIAWNDYFKQYLMAYGVREEQIVITGNPANEILYELLDKRQEWRTSLSKECGLNISKQWLFLPMNYGWAFSSDALIQAKIHKGYPEQMAWAHREYAQKCLKAFLHFIDKVASTYDCEIILRPHPSITEEHYRAAFKEEIGYIPQNILLNRTHSIREWIVASDMVGSSWSTSVWDAYIVGKSVFLFTPYPRPKWLDVWWNAKVPNIQHSDELSFCKKAKPKPDRKKSNEAIVQEIILLLSEEIFPTVRKSIWHQNMTSLLKIFRSMLWEKKLLKAHAVEYDRFKAICYGV